jgi:hypothetical protein
VSVQTCAPPNCTCSPSRRRSNGSGVLWDDLPAQFGHQMELPYLVLNHASEEWKRPPREWLEAKTQFAVIFGDRFVI